jgi:hypothetical protein
MSVLPQKMSAQELARQLPPSEREFDVFEAVVIDRRSTRDVARELSISQTRVCQLLKRVWQWHKEALPVLEEEFPDKAALQLMQLLAADRMDYLYALALRGFEASKGPQVKTRTGVSGDETITTTHSCGDIRYLIAAQRITTAAFKANLPRGLLIHSQALAADRAEELLGSIMDDDGDDVLEREATVPEVKNHPDGDCSAKSGSPAETAPAAGAEVAASRFETDNSKRLTRKQKRARRAFLSPVQDHVAAAVVLPEGSAVAQLKLSAAARSWNWSAVASARGRWRLGRLDNSAGEESTARMLRRFAAI